MIFAFDITTNSLSYRILELLIDSWFLFEIFVNFFTGYYEKGYLVMLKKKIALNYLKTWFFIDLLSSIPFSYFTSELET